MGWRGLESRAEVSSSRVLADDLRAKRLRQLRGRSRSSRRAASPSCTTAPKNRSTPGGETIKHPDALVPDTTGGMRRTTGDDYRGAAIRDGFHSIYPY